MRKGVFNLTRTGIEQGGGAQHRNQSPSGALVSPRVPISRNVYCGCCFMQPVRESNQSVGTSTVVAAAKTRTGILAT